MSISRSRRAVVATASLALLSACSGGSQLSPVASQQAQSQHVSTTELPSLGELAEGKKTKTYPLIFAADAGSRNQKSAGVYAYLDNGTNQSPIWALTGSPLTSPQALWVDGSDNLYVADADGSIYEYDKPTDKGAPTLSFTYSEGGYTPNAIAVCGNYLYASNLISPGSPGGGSIAAWKLGNASPITIVTNQNYQNGAGGGITCDSTTGSVYFGWERSYAGPGAVDKYAAGLSGSPDTTPIDPGFVQGLTANKAYANVVLGDQYPPNDKPPQIEFWNLSTGKLMHAIKGSWVQEPEAFAYEAADGYLFDADGASNAITKFKTNGKVFNTITSIGNKETFGQLTGVAVSPPDHK
jgi:hypothetical protein